MFSWLRNQLLEFGFESTKRDAFRIRPTWPFLFDYCFLGKDRHSYRLDLSIGIASGYLEGGFFSFGIEATDTLHRSGVFWPEYDRWQEYAWTRDTGEELLTAFKEHALAWFERWAEPHELITYFRFRDDEKPEVPTGQRPYVREFVKPAPVNRQVLTHLYGHLGEYSTALSFLNRYQVSPQVFPWQIEARSDLEQGRFRTVDLGRVLRGRKF